MDSELQRRKFDPWLIHSKCGNFNELANRMNLEITVKELPYMSWATSCERNTKWMIVMVRQFKDKPSLSAVAWEKCRIQIEIAVNKVAYKVKEAWTEKEYFILERLNKGIKLEDAVDPLFQVTSYFASSKLEFFIRDNMGITRNKPTTWRLSSHRSYRRFHLGIPELNDLNSWAICFRRISRNFIHNEDYSKLIIHSFEQRTGRQMKDED